MFMYKAGFIGAGNMGGAIAERVCEKIGAANVAVACSTPESTAKAANRYGCKAGIATDIASAAKFVFLGIKPQMAMNVAEVVAQHINKKTIVVSMLAGVTVARLCDMFGTDKIIRIMPNVACTVGEGMTLVCHSDSVTKEELQEFEDIISLCGKSDIIDEKYIDAASALSGCGPAFVSVFMEALADGAVKCGLPRTKAYEYTYQTLLGTAKLAAITKKHPAEIKDSVCSPGGSTIAGVSSLEENGLRISAINAVENAYKKTVDLGKM